MTDEQLLARLGAALVPVAAPSAPPSWALQDLHRAIDASRSVSSDAVPTRRRSRRVLPIAVTTAVAAACAAVIVIAMSLPRIGRETTSQITVAVGSPALGEVTDRQRALETALADGDAAAVATEAARLRLALNDLISSEWIPIRTAIEDLLSRADTFLERRRGGADGAPGVSPTMTSTTQAGLPPAGVPPTTSAPAQATSPAAPPPTARAATGVTSPSVTVADVDAEDDDGEDQGEGDVDDNSGPGGGDPGDDNSGPSGGDSGSDSDDDSSGPGGGGDSGGSGSG